MSHFSARYDLGLRVDANKVNVEATDHGANAPVLSQSLQAEDPGAAAARAYLGRSRVSVKQELCMVAHIANIVLYMEYSPPNLALARFLLVVVHHPETLSLFTLIML